MYHGIHIPKEDQQVDRFLWRGLETHREPDVYVKTVLTFGDKPAPTMAQIALRKATEEASVCLQTTRTWMIYATLYQLLRKQRV